jgi:hypothetical protein
MNTYVVHKILTVGSRQLLLVQPDAYSCSLAVYDEHTGQTLMRLSNATIEEFERAISLMKEGSDGSR